MSFLRSLLLRPLFLVLLLGVGVLSACSRPTTLGEIHGVSLAGAELGREFTLTDTQGQRVSLSDFEGKAVLVFFGFVQCPDVCPTSLLRAAQAKAMLGDDGDRLQVVFITVDPERDTPEILQTYTTAFDPSFIALSGSLDDIDRTAREFKVFYQKVPTGSTYTLDHTSLSYVYDTQGQLQLALRHEQSAQEFADDIRKVLALKP